MNGHVRSILGIIVTFAVIVALYFLVSSEREEVIAGALPSMNLERIQEMSVALENLHQKVESLIASNESSRRELEKKLSDVVSKQEQFQSRLEKSESLVPKFRQDLSLQFSNIENAIEEIELLFRGKEN